jgi:type II secretory pathway component GspD/PulD (secretin)
LKKIILSLLLASVSLQARAELEVIQLHYRSVDEVLPIVRPLLDGDGVASGTNNQLVIRSSAANIAEIREMVLGLDAAPRRLNITVMQNVDSETIRRLVQLSASVSTEHARISVAGNPGSAGSFDNSGLTVAAGQGDGRMRAHIDNSRAAVEDHKAQHVQALEGKPALISLGQAVPLQQRQIARPPGHAYIIDSTEYHAVDSGFYVVVPRLNGNRVTLEILAKNDSIQANANAAIPAMHTQKILTSAHGRLGEWMVLGGTLQQTSVDDATLNSRSVSGRQEPRNVLLKVEEAN